MRSALFDVDDHDHDHDHGSDADSDSLPPPAAPAAAADSGVGLEDELLRRALQLSKLPRQSSDTTFDTTFTTATARAAPDRRDDRGGGLGETEDALLEAALRMSACTSMSTAQIGRAPNLPLSATAPAPTPTPTPTTGGFGFSAGEYYDQDGADEMLQRALQASLEDAR